MPDTEASNPPQQPALTPVAPGARIEAIDIVRGIAILGILFVNVGTIGFPEEFTRINEETFSSTADRIVRWTTAVLVEGKFYSLFSLLFGLGVAAQASRAAQRGHRFAGLYCRRLLALLAIALVHDIVLWNGRILIAYALLGYLLIPFWNRTKKTLLIWIAVLILVQFLSGPALALLFRPSAAPPRDDVSIEELRERRELRQRQAFEERLELFRSRRYADMVRFRVGMLPRALMSVVFFTPYMLAVFLLGMWIWKAGIFQRTEERLGLIHRLAWWGLAVGAVGNALFLLPRALEATRTTSGGLVSMGGFYVGNPALCVFYLAVIVLLARKPWWRRLLAPFSAAGRTALSNYLFQALVCTTLFYGYGVGLFGTTGPALNLLIILPIFAAQLGLSVWWLRRFRFGPAEWVWRSLTYGRLQPMRKS